MLRTAFAGLSLAVGLGCWLAILHLRPDARRPGWAARAAHGAAGAGGLALLAAALLAAGGSVPAGPNSGFGRAGLILIAAALASGLGFWLGWRRLGRMRNAVLILHACLAITGFVLLSGWYLNG